MTRLEELLLKWHDQTISPAELQELNDALKDSNCRKQLMDSFALDRQLIDALRAAKALAQTAASAQQFQTLEVRKAHVLDAVPAREAIKNIIPWLRSIWEAATAN